MRVVTNVLAVVVTALLPAGLSLGHWRWSGLLALARGEDSSRLSR